jgi:hypothetical protein
MEDHKVCIEITAKEAQMCVENICWYFEQNSDDKKMQHVVALDVTVTKVGEKTVETKIDKYFIPLE